MEIQGILDFGDTSNLKYVSSLKEFNFDGLILIIKLFYSVVDESIYIDILDENGDDLSIGHKLVANFGILTRIKYKLSKDIDLIVMSIDTQNKYDKITPENFGKEMKMFYVKNV